MTSPKPEAASPIVPCPFCGDKMRRDESNPEFTGHTLDSKWCFLKPYLYQIKDWNRRIPTIYLPAAVEILRDMERDFREGGITDISDELYARIVAALSTPSQALVADYPQAAFARGVRHGLSCEWPASEFRVLAIIRDGWKKDCELRATLSTPEAAPPAPELRLPPNGPEALKRARAMVSLMEIMKDPWFDSGFKLNRIAERFGYYPRAAPTIPQGAAQWIKDDFETLEGAIFTTSPEMHNCAQPALDRLRALLVQGADPGQPAAGLDPNWTVDRESPPPGINGNLWRSLHDLCRIVRSTSRESILSTLTAYLAGCFDEFGLKLNLATPVPAAPAVCPTCWHPTYERPPIPATPAAPVAPDADRGLYRKFQVSRTDGSSGPGGKHEKCRYYVLDLDHDRFAPWAINAYALACEMEYPDLARDLKMYVAGKTFGADGNVIRSYDLASLCPGSASTGEANLLAEAMDLLENWPLPKMGDPLREELAADRKALRVAYKAMGAPAAYNWNARIKELEAWQEKANDILCRMYRVVEQTADWAAWADLEMALKMLEKNHLEPLACPICERVLSLVDHACAPGPHPVPAAPAAPVDPMTLRGLAQPGYPNGYFIEIDSEGNACATFPTDYRDLIVAPVHPGSASTGPTE